MTLTTIEATVDENGNFQLKEEVDLRGKRILITVLPEEYYTMTIGEYTARISEDVLARYWDTPEEDEAWAHLQDSSQGEEGGQ